MWNSCRYCSGRPALLAPAIGKLWFLLGYCGSRIRVYSMLKGNPSLSSDFMTCILYFVDSPKA
ncbi:hypothetical protein BofuT4_uP121720.1 [Botrytis cinerea T4]|uniref:Uncharacterized protein n=1 Tax=Botryotinia fuckeliana (strain T4) TaxID=999810 RepID=G2YNF5_BOTF4|nr:hypothetical protein BofuT4_uP121720.1 [Botrytis cinerea T4]